MRGDQDSRRRSAPGRRAHLAAELTQRCRPGALPAGLHLAEHEGGAEVPSCRSPPSGARRRPHLLQRHPWATEPNRTGLTSSNLKWTGPASPLHPQNLPTRAPRAPRPPPRWCPPAPGCAACPPLPAIPQHRVAAQQRLRTGAARGAGSGGSAPGKGNWKRRRWEGWGCRSYGTYLLFAIRGLGGTIWDFSVAFSQSPK